MLEDEKIKLTQEANRIKIILQNEKEFNQQLINGWDEVSKKFGDKRRTKVYSNLVEDEKPEKIIKDITLYVNANEDFTIKEGKHKEITNFKRRKINFVVKGTNMDNFYVFTNLGKCYCISPEKAGNTENSLATALNYEENEKTVQILCSNSKEQEVTVITKLGFIKKVDITEIFNIKKSKLYITLNEYTEDEVVEVLFGNGNEKVVIASKFGNVIIFDGSVISKTKLPSRGIIGMKFNDTISDEVASADLLTEEGKYLCSITSKGFIKKTSIDEYPETSRNTKGRILCKLSDDEVVEIKVLNGNEDILHSKVFGEIPVDCIPEKGRTARGIDLLKL